VIRHVLLVELRPDADPAAVAAIQAELRALDCPGTVSYALGNDLGLREGNWSFAVVADFENLDAFRGYDADPAHNEIRGRLAALTAQAARVQLELD
jgi:stress responsive alpha/beta barrel protein